MKKSYLFLLMLGVMFLSSCEDKLESNGNCDQGIVATVKDLTGLDGCGFVFELADGSRLEPVRLFYCGTPPLPKEVTNDPLYDFQFVDGKKVRIRYEEANDRASICMAGKMVKITCLEEIILTEE